MTTHVIYQCKNCDEEMEVEVTINEENDLPEFCPNCGYPIPDDAHEEVEIEAMSQVADSEGPQD